MLMLDYQLVVVGGVCSKLRCLARNTRSLWRRVDLSAGPPLDLRSLKAQAATAMLNYICANALLVERRSHTELALLC